MTDKPKLPTPTCVEIDEAVRLLRTASERLHSEANETKGVTLESRKKLLQIQLIVDTVWQGEESTLECLRRKNALLRLRYQEATAEAEELKQQVEQYKERITNLSKPAR